MIPVLHHADPRLPTTATVLFPHHDAHRIASITPQNHPQCGHSHPEQPLPQQNRGEWQGEEARRAASGP